MAGQVQESGYGPIAPVVNSISYVMNQAGITSAVDSAAQATPQSPQAVLTSDVFWKLAPLAILLFRK